MKVLAYMQGFPQSSPCLSSTEEILLSSMLALPFSLFKLTCLVAWAYLCLYCVQRVQSSPLVPKQYKTIAAIVSLVAGPLLLLSLVIVDAKRSSHADANMFQIIVQRIRDAVARVWSSRRDRHEEDTTIKLLDSSGTELKEIWGHGERTQDDRHVLDLTQQIVADALEQRASDILIDPNDPSTYMLRLRVDGVLRTVRQIQADTCRGIVNSIKAVASMDISERRRPQDGAFMARMGGVNASFRVASARALYGEKLSIRVLNKDASTFTLRHVGLTDAQYSLIQSALSKPSGMVLICGPTGSGKTTTMYAMLNEIDRFTHNVITVEDPIEAVLPEASQIEINPKADITFAKALRSILRQDPDVICVGEIRDEETAEIALRASQTGHLVLATIHCGSNATALVRLLDLGVSPLLLSSGLTLLVSQRLVRQLCDHCKKPAQLTPGQIQYFRSKGMDYTNVFQAGGCETCNGTGYLGRTAICDLLMVTGQLKSDLANNEALIAELKAEGDKKGKSGFSKQGLEKVMAGITSPEELARVLG
jgi:type II secretory ATPase GspE/PulE/Tfp pilus assembly ATPase PilB-like protein